MIYDLHSHTTSSDGSLTPTELMVRADIKQIDALAITDHDSVSGLQEAKQAITSKGLKTQLINGVEISTKWHGYEIHIVGLALDIDDDVLLATLETQIKHREIRAQAISDKLAKKGIENVYKDAKNKAKGGAVSRTHFAKVLLERGVVSNFDAAFKKYLGKGKSAYVSPNWMDIESAIKIIHRANGIPVLAHPIRYDMSNKWLTKLIEEFAAWGGEAIEVGLTQISPNQREHMSRLANLNGLYSSQGSDFHSPAKWIELGRNLRLTEKCIPVWQHPKWKTA
ncbi:MAG: PHP domain-containing protein [Gammaproteobacteria bacterium]|nr:PHP domain-containing protein [Gammaproteobacteria bacterium]